jgi:hypothetical protein
MRQRNVPSLHWGLSLARVQCGIGWLLCWSPGPRPLGWSPRWGAAAGLYLSSSTSPHSWITGNSVSSLCWESVATLSASSSVIALPERAAWRTSSVPRGAGCLPPRVTHTAAQPRVALTTDPGGKGGTSGGPAQRKAPPSVQPISALTGRGQAPSAFHSVLGLPDSSEAPWALRYLWHRVEYSLWKPLQQSCNTIHYSAASYMLTVATLRYCISGREKKRLIIKWISIPETCLKRDWVPAVSFVSCGNVRKRPTWPLKGLQLNEGNTL